MTAGPTFLGRYTVPDAGPHCSSVHHTPGGRSLVTNNRHLLAVDGMADGSGPLEVAVPQAKLHRMLDVVHSPPPADAMVTDLADLWLWLDRVERERCPECRGSGCYGGLEWSDPPPCELCDGDGWLLPDFSPEEHGPDDVVTLCEIPLDRNALAWWLPGELAGLGTACRVWARAFPVSPNSVNDPVPVVTVAGDRWRVAAAGLLRQFYPGRFRTYLPGAGVWYACRRDRVARLAGADWAQERDRDGFDLFGVHEESLA